jgi:hypothetical protein
MSTQQSNAGADKDQAQHAIDVFVDAINMTFEGVGAPRLTTEQEDALRGMLAAVWITSEEKRKKK